MPVLSAASQVREFGPRALGLLYEDMGRPPAYMTATRCKMIWNEEIALNMSAGRELSFERIGSYGMRSVGWFAAAWMGTGLSLLLTACGGGGGSNVTLTTTPTIYMLTVNSTSPGSGVAI